MTPHEALRLAALDITAGRPSNAKRTLSEAFSPVKATATRTRWPKRRLARVFARDGFTDRYFGQPLVFPGALRAMSVLAPEIVPYHPNWKQSMTHPAFWSHYPTIDHVVPLARGGADDEENVVTTSMLRNAAKANWLVSELGWPAPTAAASTDWDGLLPWFCQVYEQNLALQSVPELRAWYKAAYAA